MYLTLSYIEHFFIIYLALNYYTHSICHKFPKYIRGKKLSFARRNVQDICEYFIIIIKYYYILILKIEYANNHIPCNY